MSTADKRPANLLLAVDGGNSKTDVRLVLADGTPVRRAIGGPFRPQALGVPAAMAVLDALVREVLDAEGVQGPVRGIGAFLAGADLPEEITTLQAEIEARAWAELAPAGFAAAEAGDGIAGWLIDVLADEIAGMAGSAARTLGLQAPPVLLGGSVAAAGHPRLLDRVAERAPGPITVVTDAPVVG